MKNKKQIFSVVLLLLLFAESQFVSFGQNLKATQSRIESLKQRVDGFIKQPNATQDKKDKARTILSNLDELKNRANDLNEESTKTEGGKKEFAEINAKLDTLTNEFKPQSVAANTPPVSDSNSELSQTNSRLSTGNDDLQSSKNKTEKMESASFLESSSWITLALTALAGLLVLAGIITGAYFLRRNKQQEREEISLNFNQIKNKQRTLDGEIKQLTEVSKNLSQQIAQQKSEIGALKQMNQNISQATAAAPPPPTISSHQPPVEVSQFPVAVDDYLAKVREGARPVKFDHKEKMLVEDTDNEGSLLVVRDASAPGGGAFYLVPSFGIFHMKSNYTTYFENYYACARPTSGSVWIRQPATVSRVNGGWQLEQRGELEVK